MRPCHQMGLNHDGHAETEVGRRTHHTREELLLHVEVSRRDAMDFRLDRHAAVIMFEDELERPLDLVL